MTRRQWHIYIGCFFAPMLIYFSLSGAWQMFRFNDLPENQTPTTLNRVFHEMSNPHKEALLPGKDPRKSSASVLFQSLAALMAIGFVTTALLGIQMGWQVPQRRKIVVWCLVAGIVIPILLLFLN